MNQSPFVKSLIPQSSLPVLLLAASTVIGVVSHSRAMWDAGRLIDWLPALLLGAATLCWIRSIVRDRKRSAARRWLDQRLTRIEWRTFSNQTVVLDGKSFLGCSFSDLTLCYKGEAPFDFVNNHTNNVRLVVEHPRLFMLVQLLRYFGWIDRHAPISDGESNIKYLGQQPADAKSRLRVARHATGSSGS